MRQLTQFVSIQFKEFFRQPGVLFWSFAFPVLMAWGLGIAFSNKGEIIRNIAVINGENTNTSLQDFLNDSAVVSKNKEGFTFFTHTMGDEKLGKFKYNFILTNWDKALLMLKRGKANLILDDRNEEIEYHFDPVNPEAYLAYMQLSDAFGGSKIMENTQYIKPMTQTGTRYIDFLVPGLMAMGIMMSAMWGVSYSLIDKRTKKLLRRMVATPMKKTGFLFSHFLSRFSISIFETLFLFAFTWWYFDIRIQGSVFALLLLIIAGCMAFVGLAIFVSSRTSNTQIGNGLINLIVMPMMVGSGIFFSYHNFPEAVIPVIQKMPLTLMADGIRSIFLEGAGLKEVWSNAAILGSTGLVFFTAGWRIYKWY